MFKPESIVERKSVLFSIVVTGVIAILSLPIIVPHLLHGYHLAHIFLHIGGLSLAVFISVIAGFAYYRLRTKRLLFSTTAFTNFIGAEIFLLVDATWPTIYDFDMMSISEIGHLLTFITLGLLALGVFRND
ncbi:MAG: hypothetical protein OEW86_08230 [Nitrosopumilus sp.]|nr:hypothetical protein [Nitrosopumilus sp.]MDH3517097.1 hypothetical protein [Nitrosopumilus sp.]MDH5417954.1 hypothetical protein [Nitrosopumilus sp.]MDH5555503.1 hypothetical protein [Nitrosopumilus sp.]